MVSEPPVLPRSHGWGWGLGLVLGNGPGSGLTAVPACQEAWAGRAAASDPAPASGRPVGPGAAYTKLLS